MEAIVQHFIGTTQEWMSANPLLYEAVWGIEIESSGRRLLKLGDGTHYWQDLPYVDAAYIKGLPEQIVEFALQIGSLASSGQELKAALSQEIAARKSLQTLVDSLVSSGQEMEKALSQEIAARESLQRLVGQLLEFVREQMGPFQSVALITDNGFNVATHNGKTLVTLLDINHIS